MNYLNFDISEADDGIMTLEAMASTHADQLPAVMAEVQQVLDWARQRLPDAHGPLEEGGQWDHDLLVTVEDGQWQVVTFTVTGCQAFVDELLAAFGQGIG